MSLTLGVSTAKGGTGAGSSETTVGIATTTGSGLIVGFVFDPGVTFTSLTDNAGNGAPTQLSTEITGGATKQRLYYWPKITGNAAHTVTVTVSGTAFISIWVLEAKTTNANGITIDQVDRNQDAASPWTSPVLTTTIANEFLYTLNSGNGSSAGNTHTLGGSFTEVAADDISDGSQFWTGSHGQQIVSATGTYNSSWTSVQDTNAVVWLATFSEASGGGGGISISVNDTIALPTDGIVLNLLLLPNKFDSTSVTESLVITTGIILVSANDTVTVTDVLFVGSAFLLLPSVSDSTTVTDVPTLMLKTLFVSVSDSTVVIDSGINFTFQQTTLAITVGDPIPMNDVVGGILTFSGLFTVVFEAVGVNRGFFNLAWDANTEPDLAGYRVYQGTTSGVYNSITYPYTGVVANYYDVGNVLTYTVLNLNFGTTYYFVVTAYDTSNNESLPSNEISNAPIDLLLGNVTILMNALNVNDATTVTDTPKMDMLVLVKIFENNVIVSEGQALLFPFEAVAPFDATGVTEGVTVTFNTLGGISISVFDSTSMTELVNVNFSGILIVNDATTITDTVQLNMIVSIYAMAGGQDTTAVTDPTAGVLVQIVLSGPLAAFDTVTVTDTTTVQMDKVLLNIFDSVLMSDGFNLAPRLSGPGGNLTTGRLTNIAGTSQDSVLT